MRRSPNHPIGGLDDDYLRLVAISKEDVEAADITYFTRLCREAAGQPEKARLLQGNMAIEFEGYEADPRPDFLIPAIRQFIHKLDVAFPYFLYYLRADPKFNQVSIYTNSLLAASGFSLLPGHYMYRGTLGEVYRVVSPRLQAVHDFCQRVGDNPQKVLEALLVNFPSEVVSIWRRETGG